LARFQYLSSINDSAGSSMSHSNWQVHKFGGSSLTDVTCFRRVAGLVQAQQGTQQAVVVSAMGGMTDALLNLVSLAETQPADIGAAIGAIEDRYRSTAHELLSGVAERAELEAAWQIELKDVRDLLRAAALVGSAPQRTRDIVAGCGELWSARLLAAFLRQEAGADSLNRELRWVDARQLIVVHHGDLGPAVDWDVTRANAASLFAGDAAEIVLVTGFICSDKDGMPTVLGRNGSDFSASIVGSALHAEFIYIWTDVDGVMSADPNRVPDATIIHELSYNEAMELAYFGAKVIHPQTMSPAVELNIPIYIKNTFNPAAAGSKISSDPPSSLSIKGLTTVSDVALINLEGTGMIGVPGTADRLFGALREAQISVILISQASSEHSICFAVPEKMATAAEGCVRAAFAHELAGNQIQSIEVRRGCSVIAVVGDGMSGIPGIASRFFGALAKAGISVNAIAQGSSERNISAVISQAEATRALRAAHAGFYLSAETVSVGLIGPGNVGGTLLDQIGAQANHLLTAFNLDYRVRGIATSSRMYLAAHRIDLQNWRSELAEHGEPLDWTRFEAHVNPDHLPHAVMVDCTADAAIAERYIDWFRAGMHVVTPNKKAQSGPLAAYNEMQAVRREHQVHFLYETACGAALPIIHTLRDLIETGDDVRSIEGIFSGTLAYLFNVFDGSVAFSDIVSQARDSGYTEPDPRDDLSGMDVARKLCILARELGMRIELSDIDIESLVPGDLEQGTPDEFLAALSAYDAGMLERLRAAQSRGEVLRYVGQVDVPNGTASVKLRSLPAEHAFAHINLTDNIVSFASGRYSENPLVVQGPGAGPEVTAAGVFADLLRLARYLGAAG